MYKIDFIVSKDLEPFINCIMTQESHDPAGHTHIPLYADGYPGIMFQQSANGFYLMPRNKKLSELFLYGQTLDPVSLDVHGPFRFVVFQLYPFASKYLLNVDPRVLNDDCFDLLQLDAIDTDAYLHRLIRAENLQRQIGIIADLMRELVALHQTPVDDRIQQALHRILQAKGQVVIRELIDQLSITERTFERNFLSQVGLTPKQFAKIVQFQSSLHRLTHETFDKLTGIGLDSGFSDQSHFIREFKRYTGQTPSYYLEQMAVR
jgi:AraC-like DNA-binding protein